MKRIILIILLMFILTVHAQPTDVAIENFNDDDALSFRGFGQAGQNNIIPGSNPDEDFYFFEQVTAGCGQGVSAMYVSAPGSLFTGFNHVWDSNVLVAKSNDINGGASCRNPVYRLINDVPGKTEIIEMSIFMAEESSGNANNQWKFYGEGAFIAQFCQGGNTWLVQTNPAFCSTGNGGLSFGTSGGDERIKVQIQFDWDAQTMTATILEEDKGDELQKNVPKTVAFANAVTVHELTEVSTDSLDDTREMITWLDDYTLKGPQFDEPVPEVEPSEFETGLVAFASDFGFSTPESRTLFSIFLIGISMTIAAAVTRFFSDSPMKNWIILGVGIVVGSFCAIITFIEVWELTIAIVLSSASVRGIRETLSTFGRNLLSTPNDEKPQPMEVSFGPEVNIQEVEVETNDES